MDRVRMRTDLKLETVDAEDNGRDALTESIFLSGIFLLHREFYVIICTCRFGREF